MTLAKRKEWMIEVETGELLFESEEAMNLYLFTDKGFLLLNNKPQVRMYPLSVEWPLSYHDMARFMKLLPFVSKTNTLMLATDRPMDNESIAKQLEVSKSRCYAFVRRLRNAGVLRLDGYAYVVNPLYFNAAGRINQRLYILFQQDLDPHLSGWMKRKAREMWL